MTSGEFLSLRRKFDLLLAASEQERDALMLQLSKSDAASAAELKRMLAAHQNPSTFLDQSALSLVGDTTLTEPPPASRLGAQVGAYHLEKELGRGGMGVVYLASRADGSFNRRVAIKILRHDRVDSFFLTRFHRERQILAQFDHPHIASILDAGTTAEGDPYFAMEFVDGIPITTYCEGHNLSLTQRLDLFLQVCDAVQYAHRNLTVHRDLKPTNILVTQAGAVKLLDFGIAKLLHSETNQSADEPATVAILTPEYTSPEQIRREPITTSADVFSLGILLYEMISGAHPFRKKGQLAHELMRTVCEDDPGPPSGVAKHHQKQLRGELDTIVLTALRKQPAWRYPSVEQLADDIGRYRRGWPVLAKGDGLTYRLQKFARRQWVPLTAATALVLLLVLGILITTRQAQIAEEARKSADVARQQAERARATADYQRKLAEAAQRTASEQRTIAEARTQEADFERLKERQRYRDLRSLASSLLFDLHDGIRDLAGSTTARRLIVSKAQQQLELLSADSTTDVGVQRDLAAAYERMGELRVDPRHPNKNDSSAALEAYNKAVALRAKIAGRNNAPAGDRRNLALSLAKLGDGEFMVGDSKQAVESYTNSWTMAQSLLRAHPSDVSMQRALGTIDERRCAVLMGAGSTSNALAACQEGIDTLSPLAKALPDDVELQRLIASTEASYANALRLSGKPRDAAVHAKLAVESLQRLQLLAPSNAEYRRMSATAETILAGSLGSSGDTAGSLAAYRRSVRSMEIAIEIDPSDLGSPLRLAVTLLALSRRLAAGNDKDAAHDAAREALQLLERTTEKPGASAMEWNEYADALLKVDWPDLRQSAKALQLARNAVSASGRKNPFFLDTLAWGYYRTGDSLKAIETERDALALLPANAKGGLHDELDRGLHTFLGGN